MFYIDFSFLLRPFPWNVSFPVTFFFFSFQFAKKSKEFLVHIIWVSLALLIYLSKSLFSAPIAPEIGWWTRNILWRWEAFVRNGRLSDRTQNLWFHIYEYHLPLRPLCTRTFPYRSAPTDNFPNMECHMIQCDARWNFARGLKTWWTMKVTRILLCCRVQRFSSTLRRPEVNLATTKIVLLAQEKFEWWEITRKLRLSSFLLHENLAAKAKLNPKLSRRRVCMLRLQEKRYALSVLFFSFRSKFYFTVLRILWGLKLFSLDAIECNFDEKMIVIVASCQKPGGVEKEKRKTLQVLQPTASGDGTLVGSRGVVRHNETVRI